MAAPEIAVDDLYVTAYVLAHGVSLLRVDPGSYEGQRRFVFDAVAAQPLVDAFYRDGGVSAQRYAASLRHVKHLIYGRRAAR